MAGCDVRDARKIHGVMNQLKGGETTQNSTSFSKLPSDGFGQFHSKRLYMRGDMRMLQEPVELGFVGMGAGHGRERLSKLDE